MKEHALTEEESNYLADAQFLLTKRRVVEKNTSLLYQLEYPIGKWLGKLPAALQEFSSQSREGKVSIGENYQGLPYQIYDYPRNFGPKSTFALRTMIWWGNHLSCTLQLAGEALQQLEPNVWDRIAQLADCYIGVNDDPWEHHFGEDNYRRIGELDTEEYATLKSRGFLKISTKWPLELRAELPSLVAEFCESLRQLWAD